MLDMLERQVGQNVFYYIYSRILYTANPRGRNEKKKKKKKKKCTLQM